MSTSSKKLKASGLLIMFLIIFVAVILTNKSKGAILSISDTNYSFFERFLPVFSQLQRDNKFETVKQTAESTTGTYAIYIENLNNKNTYIYNEDELFYAASLYKFPIAVEALKQVQDGNLSLDEQITYTPADYTGGTGSINQTPYGTQYSLKDTLNKLMKESDNSAQSMLIRIIPQTDIKRAFDIYNEPSEYYVNNTAKIGVIANVMKEAFISDYLTAENKVILKDIMSQTFFDDRINIGLSDEFSFAHKIGNWGETGSWHDCGLAYNEEKSVIVCLMSRNTTFNEFVDVAESVGIFVNILLK